MLQVSVMGDAGALFLITLPLLAVEHSHLILNFGSLMLITEKELDYKVNSQSFWDFLDLILAYFHRIIQIY